MNEFELIDRYFRKLGAERDEVLLGVGDDAAILAPGSDAMVVCTDTMVGDVHFRIGDDAADIGHKCLAVNLSDLAAMGAEPVWATINLTMPQFDENWLAAFSAGFDELARRFGVALIGGDTARGPLVISVQTGGRVPPGGELRRTGANPGDAVFLSGTIGDGILGLDVADGRYRANAADAAYLLGRLRRPEPAVRAGIALRGIASAAIDVSDGLLADLGHLLDAGGGLGAELEITDDWFSPAARRYLEGGGDVARLIAGGDDYVLVFTVERTRLYELERALAIVGPPPVAIGRICARPGVRVRDREGREVEWTRAGYDHFL